MPMGRLTSPWGGSKHLFIVRLVLRSTGHAHGDGVMFVCTTGHAHGVLAKTWSSVVSKWSRIMESYKDSYPGVVSGLVAIRCSYSFQL